MSTPAEAEYGPRASQRALVEFSITLRWNPEFRQRIEMLREKWGLEPDGEDYDGDTREAPLPPCVEVHRYPEGFITPDGYELMGDYSRDIGAIIEEFVPLDRFPPLSWQEDAPDWNRWCLATTHALSWFVGLCIYYRIDDLPAAAGIPPMGTFSTPLPNDPSEGRWTEQIPTGWLTIRIPPDATRGEAYRLVDMAFEVHEARHTSPPARRLAQRNLKEVERTYQTWRLLQEWAGSYSKAAEELVRLGFDTRPPALTTMCKRVRTAVEDWGLPPFDAPPE
jgi:hypothetical protein